MKPDAGNPIILRTGSGLSASTAALAWAVLLFGIFSAAYTIKLIVESYCPVPFWDHWEVVGTLMRANGHVYPRDLWAQHNEHRIPIGRLLYFSDFFFFGGRGISLLCETYAIQVTSLLVLVWAMRRLAFLNGTIFITTLGFACYCCLSPLAAQNFVWPFQTTFVICGLSATAAFAFAVRYRTHSSSGAKQNLLLAACLISGFCSEAGLASGLAVWPVLVVLSFWLEFRPLHKLVLAVSAAAATAAYLIGYRTPETTSNPLLTILHPLKVGKYMLTELAAGWGSHLPNLSAWPTLAESVSLLTIAAIAIFSYRLLRSPSKSDLDIFLLANLWFLLLAIFMTALGRMRFGYEQATSGRYESVSLFFWACVAIKLASLLSSSSSLRTLLPVVQALLVILLLSVASRYPAMDTFAKDRGVYLRRGLSALERASTADPAPLFTDRKLVIQGYAFLRRQYWIPVPSFLISAKVLPGVPPGSIVGYTPATSGECEGYLDTPPEEGGGSLFLSGWAWNSRDASVPDEIVLASSSGEVIGKGAVGQNRPDVSAVRPRARSLKTGWTGEFRLTADGNYSVFAIFKRDKKTCALNGEVVVSLKPVPQPLEWKP